MGMIFDIPLNDGGTERRWTLSTDILHEIMLNRISDAKV